MIRADIPGSKELVLSKVILDYNGTLALDGYIIDGFAGLITRLAEVLEIHIVTADTFGTVRAQCDKLPVCIKVLETSNHTREKADYVRLLGKEQVAAVGNGANDLLMLQEAALGILVIGPEGCSGKTVQAADIIVKDIADALGLLLNPRRITATLRI